jgi:ethanolamine utilization microcompartment shell protein EutL
MSQAALLDSLFGTERGLSANSELRAEINELITQLEAGSPNAAPNEVSSCVGIAGCFAVSGTYLSSNDLATTVTAVGILLKMSACACLWHDASTVCSLP